MAEETTKLIVCPYQFRALRPISDLPEKRPRFSAVTAAFPRWVPDLAGATAICVRQLCFCVSPSSSPLLSSSSSSNMAHTRLEHDPDQSLANLYNDVLAGFANEEEFVDIPRPKAPGEPPYDRRNDAYVSAQKSPDADIYDRSYQQQVPVRPPRGPQPANAKPGRASRPLPKPPSDLISPVALTGSSPARSPLSATPLPYYPDEKKIPIPSSPTFQSPRPAPPPPPPPGAGLPRSTSQQYAQNPPYLQQPMRRNESAPAVHIHSGFRPPPGAAMPTPPGASNGTPPYHHSNGGNDSAQDIALTHPPSRNVSYSSSGSGRTPDSPGAYSPIAVNPMTKSTFDLSGGIDGGHGLTKFDHYPPPPVPATNFYREDSLNASSSLQREGSFSSSIYGGTATSLHQVSPPAQTASPLPPMITPPAPIPVTSSPAPPVPAPVQRHTHNAQSSSSSRAQRHAEELQRTIASLKAPLEDFDTDVDEFDEDIDEDPDRYVILALLSHLAVRLRDKVPRGTHVKGSIPYARAFTGKDVVVRRSKRN